MKKQAYLTILLIIVIAILVWLLRKRAPTLPNKEQTIAQTNAQVATKPMNVASSSASPNPPRKLQSVQSRMEDAKQRWEHELSLWQSPLLYYGKVVDESNQPISGVQVSYGANSMNAAQAEVYNTGTVTTDERGIFKIEGVRGVNLMVQLSDPDYYPYPENSTGFDKRRVPSKGYFSDSEENAELFRMHSKGHPVALVHRVDGMNVPLNGKTKTLNLLGVDYKQTIGQLTVKATGTPPPRYNQQPFDWNVKITVPDGGLVEFTNQFDFIAPDSGYRPSIEFDFPKETPGWTDTVSKNYFVKLPSGYMRLNIYIGAKQPLFFSVEYDYNPDGSHNLERAK